MTEKFKVEFLPDAVDFMEELDKKAREKIYFNIRKAQVVNDPELFKKLNHAISESGRFTTRLITGCLPFGTKQVIKKRWCCRHMD